jgi:hypothetical protein
MQNKLNLTSYIPAFSENTEKDQYAFHYNLLTADKDEVLATTGRWVGKEYLLKQAASSMLAKTYNWSEPLGLNITDENLARLQIPEDKNIENLSSAEGTRFSHDMRGVRVYDTEITGYFSGFDYTRLDNSLIEKSRFIRIDCNRQDDEFIGFSECQLIIADFRNAISKASNSGAGNSSISCFTTAHSRIYSLTAIVTVCTPIFSFRTVALKMWTCRDWTCRLSAFSDGVHSRM